MVEKCCTISAMRDFSCLTGQLWNTTGISGSIPENKIVERSDADKVSGNREAEYCGKRFSVSLL